MSSDLNSNTNNIDSIDSLNFDIDLDFGKDLDNKFLSQTADSVLNSNPTNKVDSIGADYKSLLYISDFYTKEIVKDIEIYSEYVKFISTDEENKSDIRNLEKYRSFPNKSLIRRGVSYSEDIPYLYERFDRFKESSLLKITNTAFTQKYLLPIKLPNGNTYTFMGYNPYPDYTGIKYEMPNQKWVNQSNLIGNLNSIFEYQSNFVYICEGYFDAITLNEYWNVPSFCIFGSKLTRTQLSVLNTIKTKYKKYYIYVPDSDTLNSNIVKHKVWDFIWKLPNVKDKTPKDVNDYVSFYIADDNKDLNNVRFNDYVNNIPIYKPSSDLLQYRKLF